jgi:hypothetical protein
MNGRSALTRAGDWGLSAKKTSATNFTPCVAPSRAVHMARTFSRTDRASFFLLKGNPLEDIFSVAAEHDRDVKAAGEQTAVDLLLSEIGGPAETQSKTCHR